MQPTLPAWPLWALAGTLLALPRWRYSGRLCVTAFLMASLVFGVAWAAWRAESRLLDELPVAWEGKDIELIGTVAALPQDFGGGSRFVFDVETVLTPEAVVPAHISLSWYQNGRDGQSFVRQPVLPGERWRFTARLKRPHGNANPGGFDYEAWLLENSIRATGYIRPVPPQRLDEMVWQADYAIERLRHRLRAGMFALLPGQEHPWSGILVVLVVGDQKAIQGDLWTTFNRTGTTHLMSI